MAFIVAQFSAQNMKDNKAIIPAWNSQSDMSIYSNSHRTNGIKEVTQSVTIHCCY